MNKLSILIPTFNEATTIREVLTAVMAQKLPGIVVEVVVIDDASTDGTSEILQECTALYSRLVTLPRNSGKGAAVISGLEVASGDYILVQDADLEYSPHDYGALLKPVQTFDADIVIGSRFLAPAWTRVNYFWHMIGNRAITLMFNVLNNTTFTDVYSGFLLFRTSLLLPGELKCFGWDQQAEILSKMCPRSKVVYEVPISYHGRSYEEGKKIRALDAIPVLWTMLRVRIARMIRRA
jgi:glycosyltransferase involved in cell wall biosynthesis